MRGYSCSGGRLEVIDVAAREEMYPADAFILADRGSVIQPAFFHRAVCVALLGAVEVGDFCRGGLAQAFVLDGEAPGEGRAKQDRCNRTHIPAPPKLY